MTHFIYIPGFGDRFNFLRRLALRRWEHQYGVKTTVVPMCWSDKNETYQQKYERVVAAINNATDGDVHVVGESAGGAMALYVLSQLPMRVTQVTTICGYNNNADVVIAYQRQRHPAFHPLVHEVDRALMKLPMSIRQRATTIYSRRDSVIKSQYSHINGAREIILSTPGHLFSIAYVLLRTLHRVDPSGS